jgi:hypothetical protein
MNIRHFVVSPEGSIREFSPEQAALIAAGLDRLPEFAGSRVRYLQVSVDDANESEYKIRTAGAAICFDAEGRVVEAAPPTEQEILSRFEHDACVQWALKDLPTPPLTFH